MQLRSVSAVLAFGATGSFDIDLEITHVPEPSTYTLLGSALFVVGCARRRKLA